MLPGRIRTATVSMTEAVDALGTFSLFSAASAGSLAPAASLPSTSPVPASDGVTEFRIAGVGSVAEGGTSKHPEDPVRNIMSLLINSRAIQPESIPESMCIHLLAVTEPDRWRIHPAKRWNRMQRRRK